LPVPYFHLVFTLPVLAYLSRYTHRVAISNSRLISVDDAGVIFKWKDYRRRRAVRARTGL
jgi:hypothetical protein